MPWTVYLQRYCLERGEQFIRQKLKDKTPIKSNNLSYNRLVFFKEICNDKSAFKLSATSSDRFGDPTMCASACTPYQTCCETLLVLKSFFNHFNCVSKSSQYLILRS